jgi:hypothetical protein
MMQRVRLNASRKNGFVVTVSTRALNVESLIKSLSGFDHQRGIRPQRYSRALTPAIAEARPLPQGSESPGRLHSQATVPNWSGSSTTGIRS